MRPPSTPKPKPVASHQDMTLRTPKKAVGHPHANLGKYLHKAKGR